MKPNWSLSESGGGGLSSKKEILVELVGREHLVDPYYNFGREIKEIQAHLARFHGVRGPRIAIAKSDLTRNAIEKETLPSTVRVVVSGAQPIKYNADASHRLVVNVVVSESQLGWRPCEVTRGVSVSVPRRLVKAVIRSVLCDIYLANSYAVSELVRRDESLNLEDLYARKVEFCLETDRKNRFGDIEGAIKYIPLASLEPSREL